MKEIQNLLKPKVSPFETSLYLDLLPEIFNISYVLSTLRISLNFEKIATPIYVEFKSVIGYRVLDEGNLIEFWNNNESTPGWLWRVQSGGWFELEKLRNGLLAQHHGKGHNEFLVCGLNDCVSVIAESDPLINVAE